MARPKPHSVERVRGFFADLGPGFITGAADDDPSGISTYSVTGASFGYMPLWTALFSFPLMAAVQLMCARLGLVTGRGLAGVVRRYYPRSVLWGACALLIVANVFNIGADLGGMAEATEMMTGIKSYYWTPALHHPDYLTALFIILTTAATLHAHGQTHIETAREAAEALRPLAGSGAYLLFTPGLIGTGMLAVPVLVVLPLTPWRKQGSGAGHWKTSRVFRASFTR